MEEDKKTTAFPPESSTNLHIAAWLTLLHCLIPNTNKRRGKDGDCSSDQTHRLVLEESSFAPKPLTQYDICFVISSSLIGWSPCFTAQPAILNTSFRAYNTHPIRANPHIPGILSVVSCVLSRIHGTVLLFMNKIRFRYFRNSIAYFTQVFLRRWRSFLGTILRALSKCYRDVAVA